MRARCSCERDSSCEDRRRWAAVPRRNHCPRLAKGIRLRRPAVGRRNSPRSQRAEPLPHSPPARPLRHDLIPQPCAMLRPPHKSAHETATYNFRSDLCDGVGDFIRGSGNTHRLHRPARATVHGLPRQGRSRDTRRIFPRIAGKPAGYLYNQLVNFRDGRRTFPMMTYLVDRQSDDYLKELAAYFASQELPYAEPAAPTASSDDLEHGRRLVFNGDERRHIPSCRSCHGTQLVGVSPAVRDCWACLRII